MSGLSIDHGGAIAVDTGQLRDLATRVRGLLPSSTAAEDAVARAEAVLSAGAWSDLFPIAWSLRAAVAALGELVTDIEAAAADLLLTAEVYDVVELRAQAQVLAQTDAAAAAAREARLRRLLAADERLGPLADALERRAQDRRFRGLDDQFDAGGLLPPLFSAGAVVGMTSGLGRVRPGMTLSGTADPVRVGVVASSRPNSAPSGLAGALRRMPASAGAQVAVERYTMPGGATRYVAYLGGSRSMAPGDAGGTEPWDMKSNVELYTGGRSASYQATLDALAAAGARPGDRVDVVAHSQGGMIAAHLARESGFAVTTQLTAGSPVEPVLSTDQTLVQLRHTDDVVSALAAGGSPEGTGAPDSFIASRVGDPDPGPQDFALQTHALETYIETAEQVDASDDPRAVALDAYWTELDRAVAVERTEYRAERVASAP
ncbi:hypothetical protein [Microbacterium sp. BLY]|uniref:hypothetical protein n=1 Tax=Microbacterium sp. BLY TaxID=2823280 RepID=UPI001B32A4E1|nr:hypothetical protein [Microbacterium sp. BLY]MBP3976764.1 hypothetical protein [Microbacterium sp. BLY]